MIFKTVLRYVPLGPLLLAILLFLLMPFDKGPKEGGGELVLNSPPSTHLEV